MLKTSIRNLAIVTILFFLFPLSTAHAQTYKSDATYFAMVKTLVIKNTSTDNQQVLGAAAQPTITPTLTPTPTPRQFPFQRRTFPTPLPTKTPNASPVPTSESTEPMTFVMNEINAYRKSLGLAPVATSTQTCNFAATRAKEIVTDFSHNGFQQRINTKTIPYTSWTKITENIAMTSSYKQVVTLWKNSPGHAANMRENTPYVCVRQSGNYFAYEGMKP